MAHSAGDPLPVVVVEVHTVLASELKSYQPDDEASGSSIYDDDFRLHSGRG